LIFEKLKFKQNLNLNCNLEFEKRNKKREKEAYLGMGQIPHALAQHFVACTSPAQGNIGADTWGPSVRGVT
jgi:hypothetical protein